MMTSTSVARIRVTREGNSHMATHGPGWHRGPFLFYTVTMRHTAIIFVVFLCSITAAEATCGDRTGPGYRGPDGQCVSWYGLAKGVCDCHPPLSKCTPERVHAGAEKIGKLACRWR
jgi:hypothetical protein